MRAVSRAEHPSLVVSFWDRKKNSTAGENECRHADPSPQKATISVGNTDTKEVAYSAEFRGDPLDPKEIIEGGTELEKFRTESEAWYRSLDGLAKDIVDRACPGYFRMRSMIFGYASAENRNCGHERYVMRDEGISLPRTAMPREEKERFAKFIRDEE